MGNSPDITDPLTILTYKDTAGVCVPQRSDAGAINVAGCCAAPGRRGCSGNAANGFAFPACLSLDATLTLDSYNAGILCALPSVSVDPVLPTLGQTGTDMTFYVTSDIHFFRRTYNLTDQITHVKVLNNFFSTAAIWPAGTGIPANTAVDKPLAVVIDGDITTHGLAQDLGAFRINYERGTVPASIQYPVLFGIGNHETVSDETPENAKRMFDYLQARMANTHIDPTSGDYSWDWQGVHMVQLNTWAGDQTSAYAHVSDGLAWLANDLKTYVGNTTRPVMLFEHYLLKNVYPWRVSDTANDDFFPTDENAIDSTGAKTGLGYETFWKIIQSYNVIGMFGGHDHCLGIYNTMLSTLPLTGSIYPDLKGYGVPLDDYDDGSGGDTNGGAGEVAGVGNACPATTINGESIPQTAVASFLAVHVNQHYLDVGAVSWTGDGSAPYFDPAEGLPTGALACRKRINSQFVAAPSSVMVTQTANGYSVVSSADTPAGIPVALQFNSRSGVTGFNFVDACADPTDTGANNLYLLVNGENSLTANTAYSVAGTETGTSSVTHPVGSHTTTSDNVPLLSGSVNGVIPAAVLLTPLSGVTPSSFQHTTATAPANDSVTVYGPPGTAFSTQVSYAGSADNWISLMPASGTFNAYGIATIAIQYTTPPTGFGSTSTANIAITSTGTGVIQNVAVTIVQPSLSLLLSTLSIYQGGSVTFTAALTPASAGVLMNFTTGTTLLGSAQTDANGIATFAYAANSLGTFPVVATINAASLNSPSVTLTVGPPVSLVASPTQITILPGKVGTVLVSLTPFGGFTGPVTITCNSPVTYMTCTPATFTIALSSAATTSTAMTIGVAATTSSLDHSSGNSLFALLAPFGLLCLGLTQKRGHTLLRASLIALVAAVSLVSLTGCGRKITLSVPSPGQSPSGSQVVTITAITAGATSTASVTVNFQ